MIFRNKKLNYTYYIAMLFALLGMHFSFFKPGINASFLTIVSAFILVYGMKSVLSVGRYLAKSDFIVIVILSVVSILILTKSFYYGNIFFKNPIIAICCIIILITIIAKSNSVNYYIFFLMNFLGSISLIIAMFTEATDYYGAFQIRFINPQIISSWAFAYAVNTVILYDYFIDNFKHKFLPAFSQLVLYLMLLVVSLLTDARFSTFLMIIMLCIRILKPLRLFNCKTIRFVWAFAPVLVLIVSEVLSFLHVFTDMPGGSLLNGREQIWLKWLSQGFSSLVFGISYQKINADVFYSHNIFVDYYAMFGLFSATAIFLGIAYIFLKKVPYFSIKKRNGHERMKYDAFTGFVLMLVASSVEGGVFSGGGGAIFIYSLMPLIVSVASDK